MVEGDGLENRSAKAPGVRIPPPPQCRRGQLLLGAITMSLLSCDTTAPCDPGVDQAGRYKVDVVERYDEQSQFTYSTAMGKASGLDAGPLHDRPHGARASSSPRHRALRAALEYPSVTADVSPPPAELSVVGAATNIAVTETLKGNGSALFFMGDVTSAGVGTLGLAVLPGYRQADFFTRPLATTRLRSCSRCCTG